MLVPLLAVEEAIRMGPPDDLPVVLTVEEAAAVLRLKRSTTYELIRQGQIPSFRVGRFIRVPRDALFRMAQQSGQDVRPAGGAK